MRVRSIIVLVPAVMAFLLPFRSIPEFPGVTPKQIQQARELHQRYECIQSELSDELEPGDRVFIDIEERPFKLGEPVDQEEWRQRLAEMAYPEAEAVSDRTQADKVVSVRPGSMCSGLSLVVKAP